MKRTPTDQELDAAAARIYELDDFVPRHPSERGPFLDDGEPVDESKYLIRDEEDPGHGA